MARSRARPPHRLLRVLLLVLGLAMIGTVGVMLMAARFGAASQPTTLVPGQTDAVATLPDDDLFRGQGFEFRHEIEGRPLFFIQASGIRQDRAEIAHLEEVNLELYRSSGDVVRVRSDEADYDQSSRDATLTGNVEVRGRGLELDTRTLLVSHDGKSLLSPTPVTVRYPPGLAGRASSLRVNLEAEVYLLTDGVHLHSTPSAAIPLRLDAERVIHRREEAVIRAIGDVRLERAGDVIVAQTLIINLIEGSDGSLDGVETVRARHGAQADVLADPGLAADRIRATGEHLLIRFDPATGRPRFFHVDGDTGIAQLERFGADGFTQGFTGSMLEGRFSGGLLRRVEGRGAPVVLTESIAMRDGAFPLRQACAEELDMDLLGGVPVRLNLRGRVDLADGAGAFVGGASQADVDFVESILRVTGPQVSFYHDDGQVIADAFVYRRTIRQLRAEGDVAALLEERASRALRATPLGRGQGPIQVEADKASWTLDPAAFVFTDGVRAWRGDNLLFADQLRGDEAAQQVSAAGAVRTTWMPTSAAPGVPVAPIEVSAERMVYDRERSALVYSGAVDALQAGRKLRCDELRIDLANPDGTAERMACEGDVVLDDPALGRQVAGDRAVYGMASHRIEITGDPVTVREAGGGVVRCRYFRYETDTGAVEIRSAPPADAAPTTGAATAETRRR